MNFINITKGGALQSNELAVGFSMDSATPANVLSMAVTYRPSPDDQELCITRVGCSDDTQTVFGVLSEREGSYSPK